jgi:hypothetical protein
METVVLWMEFVGVQALACAFDLRAISFQEKTQAKA